MGFFSIIIVIEEGKFGLEGNGQKIKKNKRGMYPGSTV